MRRVVIVALVLGLAAAAAAVLGSSLHAAVSQTLHGNVNGDYQITLVFDDGSAATSAPAGSYRIVINDQTSEHNFHLSGPGVDVDTGIDQVGTQSFTINLQNNNQYTFVCDAHPDTMRGIINVGTPSSSSSTPTQTTGSKPITNVPSGPAVHNNNTVATLTVTVSGTKVTLLRGGKAVTRLPQGLYSFKVTTPTAKGIFTLVRPKGGTVRLGGNHTTSVDLTAGTWKYYSSLHAGTVHTFKVTV